MSKLSKKEAKLHQEAIALIRADRALTEDEQALVLDQFQEGAAHMNGLAGAFFTPRGLARDFAIEVVHSGGSRRRRVLDLCAGIGGLSWACQYGDEVDFVGPENELHVSNAMKHAHALVFAWGSVQGPDKPFHEGLMGGLARRANALPLCLGTTKTGAPRHPLYVSYETALKPWQPGWR